MINSESGTSSLTVLAVAPKSPEFLYCLDILDEAAARLHRAGIVQWPEKFDARRIAKLEEFASREEMLIVLDQERPVATITITEWADPDFAEHWPSPAADALYLCRAAVSNQARGQRLGQRFLIPTAERRARRLSKGLLRLDCSRRNINLHQHYQGRWGFRHVGTVEVPGRKSGALFQREVCEL